MTHTHTIGSRHSHGMVAGGTCWESSGLLNTSKRPTSAFAGNRSVTTGNRIARPSFLRMDLEDLHRGTFNEMNARIDALPKDSTLADLSDRLLDHIEKVHGATVCREVLGLLWASRRGLSISEATTILGCRQSDVEDLCAALASHLIKRNGLLTFAHNGLRAAVQNRYITEETRLDFHARIARTFMEEPYGHRRVDELPWQLEACEFWNELKETISDLTTATTMIASADSRADLGRYWKSLSGRFDVVIEYITSLDRADETMPAAWVQEATSAIVRFLAEIGRPDGVEALRRRDERHYRRITPLHRVPILLVRRIRNITGSMHGPSAMIAIG